MGRKTLHLGSREAALAEVRTDEEILRELGALKEDETKATDPEEAEPDSPAAAD